MAVDWSISLHPAWDRMYLSGMTVREISDYTGRARSTVQRHLQNREQYDGALRPMHEIRRAARGPGWPGIVWQHHYKDVQNFTREQGRLPQRDGSPEERLLGEWLSKQRRDRRKGLLSDTKAAVMDVIEEWDVSPRQRTADEHWKERLAQLMAFIADHGHSPRYRGHTNEHERILGVWLHTQHQLRAEGELLPWRLTVIDEALPGWRSRM